VAEIEHGANLAARRRSAKSAEERCATNDMELPITTKIAVFTPTGVGSAEKRQKRQSDGGRELHLVCRKCQVNDFVDKVRKTGTG
jgi:hypothetical protein